MARIRDFMIMRYINSHLHLHYIYIYTCSQGISQFYLHTRTFNPQSE